MQFDELYELLLEVGIRKDLKGRIAQAYKYNRPLPNELVNFLGSKIWGEFADRFKMRKQTVILPDGTVTEYDPKRHRRLKLNQIVRRFRRHIDDHEIAPVLDIPAEGAKNYMLINLNTEKISEKQVEQLREIIRKNMRKTRSMKRNYDQQELDRLVKLMYFTKKDSVKKSTASLSGAELEDAFEYRQNLWHKVKEDREHGEIILEKPLGSINDLIMTRIAKVLESKGINYEIIDDGREEGPKVKTRIIGILGPAFSITKYKNNWLVIRMDPFEDFDI
jgi:hypothetical protein